MKRQEIAQFVEASIATRKIDDIYPLLVEAGVAPCVAREWANEPYRRAALARRRQEREERRRPIGLPGAFGRRIIKTELRGGREHQLHATKGWRERRMAA